LHPRTKDCIVQDKHPGLQRPDLRGTLEVRPAELGFGLEPRMVEPGPALETGSIEPGLALELGFVEPGLALETCPVEPGPTLEDRTFEPGSALEAGLIEPNVAPEGVAVTFPRHSGQDSPQQLGADDHSARIDRAFCADTLEFSLKGGGGLLDGMGEAQRRGRKLDTDAILMAAPHPVS
jgi:hypothetical protein